MPVSEGSDNGRCDILSPDQWPLVKTMRLAALADAPRAFLGDLEQESQLVEDDWRKTFDLASWHGHFVAADIVGIARSSILPQYPQERYLESFWIRPAQRHLHVARMIMASVVSEARSEGRGFIRLSVLRENQAILKTLRHLGFSSVVADPDRTTDLEYCLEFPIAQ